MNTNFELLFPTPVMFGELGRKYTKKELDLAKKRLSEVKNHDI